MCLVGNVPTKVYTTDTVIISIVLYMSSAKHVNLMNLEKVKAYFLW